MPAPRRTPPTAPPDVDQLRASILAAWQTNCRATALLVEHLPAPLWGEALPGESRRTIRSLAGHLHNARSRWIRTLGREHGIIAPPLVDLHRVTRRQLLAALRQSERGLASLLQLGCDAGGVVPPSVGYIWRNLPLDVGHVLAYFVAHEAHHRGQLIMLARQMGHRLPRSVSDGVWQWATPARRAPKRRS